MEGIEEMAMKMWVEQTNPNLIFLDKKSCGHMELKKVIYHNILLQYSA